jgi:macrolide-specific efflux system membrane fusion protein
VKKNYVIIALILTIIVAGGLYYKKTRKPAVVYTEQKITRGDLILKVQSSGTVSPQNRLEIKPPVAGRIEEVLVKEGDVVKKGAILAWISSTERAALLDAVRAQGAKELKRWESLYKPTPVVAPIDGTLILRKVETGQSFINTDPIFTMADRLTVKAQVDETDISQIKMNQPAIIRLDAYPNEVIPGSVVHVAYDATITNNVTTYIVDVLPNEVPEFMRSGMTSNVEIEVAHKSDVILVPMTSLVTNDSGTNLLVKGSKGPQVLPVTTGADDGKNIEIVSGVIEGDIVLTEDTTKQFSGGKPSSPFMPSGPRRGGGGRK